MSHFTINCDSVVTDKVLDITSFHKYLQDATLKVNKKVKSTTRGAQHIDMTVSNNNIVVDCSNISKRYLKVWWNEMKEV